MAYLPTVHASNERVARAFLRTAELLEHQGANPHRIRAYRSGAQALQALDENVEDLLRRDGERGLIELPGIGRGLAAAAIEVLTTGRYALCDRLEGEVSPEDLFARVPGIGEELAHRIVEVLHIETLEELELAAHDGRLGEVAGFGPRRVEAVQNELDAMLRRSRRRRARLVGLDGGPPEAEPPAWLLLEVDARYRELAEAGKLHRIAPRRFNPKGEAWLPILHDEQDGWSFTAMYSNTARAHQLDRTHDWVVIYYERDHDGHEHQCTVVTETRGLDAGERVVRGRERECRALHERRPRPRLRFAVPKF